MKYWQPTIRPPVHGWTLHDVPNDVLCEVTKSGHDRLYVRRHGTNVIYGRGSNSSISPHTVESCQVLRVIEALPSQSLTLDKVPENVNCVLSVGEGKVCVGYRVGDKFYDRFSVLVWDCSPTNCDVLHIIDPLQTQILTLDTVPVGRVVMVESQTIFKTHEGDWFWWNMRSGEIGAKSHVGSKLAFTTTDFLMELRELTK